LHDYHVKTSHNNLTWDYSWAQQYL